jgi:hypothetical protein
MMTGGSINGRGRQGFLRPWIALLTFVSLLVAGCGGGGGDTSSSATEGSSAALTRAELLEQGNAICAKAYPAIVKFDPEGTTKEAVQAAALTENMAEELLALGVPQETDVYYVEYANASRALVKGAAAIKAAAKHDPATLKNAEAASLSMLSSFQNWSNEYGLKDCDLVAYMAAEDSSQAP